MHPMEMTARQVEWVGQSFAHNLGFIPEDKFDWKPEPTANSAQEIVNHLVSILQGAVGVLNGGEFERKPVNVSNRDEAQQLILSVTKAQANGLRALAPSDLERTITLPFGAFPLAQAAMMATIDLTHHHGQIVYLQTLLGDTEMHSVAR
ncbi:MAG: DinB family protein [Abitibacteriaceae bacterium]|nr:DinB family protein [Abditibacteriaceae bacterium]